MHSRSVIIKIVNWENHPETIDRRVKKTTKDSLKTTFTNPVFLKLTVYSSNPHDDTGRNMIVQQKQGLGQQFIISTIRNISFFKIISQ